MGDVFRALADPTRRAILDEHTDRDGQALFEISARLTTKHALNSTRQAISQHLEVLQEAGLVRTSRSGRHKVPLHRYRATGTDRHAMARTDRHPPRPNQGSPHGRNST